MIKSIYIHGNYSKFTQVNRTLRTFFRYGKVNRKKVQKERSHFSDTPHVQYLDLSLQLFKKKF